jgi:hypothetical protein
MNVTGLNARYFLWVDESTGRRDEREVSVDEYCRSERAAGLRPKVDPRSEQYWKTPASNSWSFATFSGGRLGGHIKYEHRIVTCDVIEERQ